MVVTRSGKNTMEQSPSPLRIDFSKIKPKLVSAPIVFHPTLEYKLAETEKKLAEQQEAIKEWEARESVCRTEMEEWKKCYNDAMRTIYALRQRIYDH